jgi:pimeloyl-ACP methyl ester carboxylesterase
MLAAAAAGLALNRSLVGAETKPAESDGGELLELDGLRAHAQVEGPEDRPPIVMLHGFAGSLRWFDRLATLLRDELRLIRLDLIGHGGSEKPASGYSIPEQAQFVAAALERLSVAKATIIGHSMGGAVAVSLAERAPELVDRLLVLDEGPDNSFGGQPLVARLGFVPVLGEVMHRLAIDPLVRDGYRDAFAPGFDLAQGFDDPDQVVRDFRRMTYTSYKQCWVQEGSFLAAKRLDARVRELQHSTTIVFGTEDKFFRAQESADAFRAVDGVRVELIDGAGHSPNVERPEQIAALVREAIGS